MPEEALDILLTLSGLRSFVAGTGEASAAVRRVGAAAKESSAESAAASSRMSGVAGLASKAFKGTAVAVAAFAYESTKMAVNFDKQMEMIHTQAGATQGEVKLMESSILAMSASGMYAQGPQQLAEGLFHLESIGLRGSKALNALKVAAQGAAVGNANLEDTTTALGSAWLVGIKGAGNLHNVMALLNATVGAGNMRMNDLVQSLGTGVLPAAKLAGLGITDVMGALATLTDEGWQGSSAMAQLATSFHFLTDPTEKAKKALASIGLSRFQLSDIMRTQGLQPALATLRQHLAALSPAQQQATLGDILPAGRGRVLEVLMNQVDRYGTKLHQIQATSKNFAQDVAATHRTAAFKINAAWSQVQASMIRLGHILEPLLATVAHDTATVVTALVTVAPALAHILPFLVPLAAGFLAYKGAVMGVWAAEKLWAAGELVMAILLPLLSGSLLEATVAFTALSTAMEVNPIVLVVTALVALGVALVMAYNHVAWFRNGVNAVWKWLKGATRDTIGAVVAAFHWMSNAAGDVAKFVREHWRIIIFFVLGPLGLAIDVVTKHWGFFKHAAQDAWNAISSGARWAWNTAIKPVLNWIVGAAHWVGTILGKVFGAVAKVIAWPFTWAWKHVIQPVANWIVSAFRWVVSQVTTAFNKILGPVKSVIGWLGGATHSVGHFAHNVLGLQGGGTITRPGAVWVGEHGPELLNLPVGAQVRPLNSPGVRPTGALTTNFTIVVPVSIDRREVARATGKYVDDRLARQ